MAEIFILKLFLVFISFGSDIINLSNINSDGFIQIVDLDIYKYRKLFFKLKNLKNFYKKFNKKIAKGIVKSVIKKELKHETYKEILESGSKMYSHMKVIRSQKHRIYTMDINKVSLSAYDDKRWITDDGISSFAYGHFRIPTKTELEECFIGLTPCQ